MLGIPILIAPLAAFLIGLCAVPSVRRIALACGFLDNPDRRRKLHSAPIALGGGLAVWLATWSGWGISLLRFSSETPRWPATRVGSSRRLCIASLLILCLGVIDDRHGLRGRHKLAGQVVVAVILVGLGLRIDAWSCFGVEVRLGILRLPRHGLLDPTGRQRIQLDRRNGRLLRQFGLGRLARDRLSRVQVGPIGGRDRRAGPRGRTGRFSEVQSAAGQDLSG